VEPSTSKNLIRGVPDVILVVGGGVVDLIGFSYFNAISWENPEIARIGIHFSSRGEM